MELYFILGVVVFFLVAGVLTTVTLLGGEGKRSKVTQRLEALKESKQSGTIVLEGSRSRNPLMRILVGCGKLIAPGNEAKRRRRERKLHAEGI